MEDRGSSRQRYATVKRLFLAARDLPEHERDAYITREAGQDLDLATQVRQLLHESQHSSAQLEDSVRLAAAEATTLSGVTQIGPYAIIRKIGAGGFGDVYEAEQLQPVRRRVALKIMKAGLDARAVGRFEAEQQSLASLDHPCIAKIFDGGTVPDIAPDTMRPYFVMEFVDGVALTDFCDQQRLPIAERLRLLIRVSDAIHHAHLHGIIHRDLKPSNILVQMRDGEPHPKIIDFGIAKGAWANKAEMATLTDHGVAIGTPEYMSPEQADGQGIDTRTDVYSLGVILYELLSGTLPIESSRLRSVGKAELRRIIREDEPVRPSTKVISATSESGIIATTRATAPDRLISELQRELDWIAVKALAKSPTQRYQSASELAADMQRYLSGEPIDARRGNRLYRVAKLAARHKLTLAGVASIGLAVILMAMAVFSNMDARRQRQQRDRESQVKLAVMKALERVVAIADSRNGGRNANVYDALEIVAKSCDEDLTISPETNCTVHQWLARTSYKLTENQRAEKWYSRARALAAQSFGAQSAEYATITSGLGASIDDAKRQGEAEQYCRDAVRLFESIRQANTYDYIEALYNLAQCVTKRDVREALLLAHKAVDAARSVGDRPKEARGIALLTLGEAAARNGDEHLAQRSLQESLELLAASAGEFDAFTTAARFDLWYVSPEKHTYQELQTIIQRAEKQLGPESPMLALFLDTAGTWLTDINRNDEAEAIAQRSLDIFRKIGSNGSPVTANVLVHRAQTMYASLVPGSKRAEVAAQYLREAVSIFEKAEPELDAAGNARFGPTGSITNDIRAELGTCLSVFTNEREEAARVLKLYLGDFERAGPGQGWAFYIACGNYSATRVQLRIVDDETEAAARIASEYFYSIDDARWAAQRLSFATNYNTVLTLRGKFAQAESFARQRLSGNVQTGSEHSFLAEALLYTGKLDEALSEVYADPSGLDPMFEGLVESARGDCARAKPLLIRAVADGRYMKHRLALAKSTLGVCYAKEGRSDEAEQMLCDGYQEMLEVASPTCWMTQLTQSRVQEFYRSKTQPDRHPDP